MDEPCRAVVGVVKRNAVNPRDSRPGRGLPATRLSPIPKKPAGLKPGSTPVFGKPCPIPGAAARSRSTGGGPPGKKNPPQGGTGRESWGQRWYCNDPPRLAPGRASKKLSATDERRWCSGKGHKSSPRPQIERDRAAGT